VGNWVRTVAVNPSWMRSRHGAGRSDAGRGWEALAKPAGGPAGVMGGIDGACPRFVAVGDSVRVGRSGP